MLIDNLENRYSKKIQPLFELGDKNISYRGERFDYTEKFNFQKEDIPELIRLAIDNYDFDYDTYELEINRFYNATIHAMLILSQLKAIESVEPILQKMYAERNNDFLQELVPEFLSNMGYEVVTIIKKHLFEEHKDKLSFFEAITKTIKKYPDTKDVFTEILIDYIQSTKDNSDHLSFAISSLLDFSGSKHIDFIRNMFKTRDVSFDLRGDIEDIEIELGLREQRITQKPKTKMQEIFESLEFQNEVPARKVRTKPKIGRNAPCPCGSGKKYKKCCLKVKF